MKKIISLALLAAVMISFTSCKKKSDSSETAVTTPSLSMKFNGNSWVPTTITAAYLSYNSSTTITAYKTGTSDQFVLIYAGKGTGTYNFADDEAFGSGNIGSSTFSTIMFDYTTGSVIVTAYDSSKKLISGTFSFSSSKKSESSLNVTEGKFDNIPLTGKY
jgi:hypothetical protein